MLCEKDVAVDDDTLVLVTVWPAEFVVVTTDEETTTEVEAEEDSAVPDEEEVAEATMLVEMVVEFEASMLS